MFGSRSQTPSHRPDVVLISVGTEQVVLMELTAPWGERMDEAQGRKGAEYVELVAECRGKGGGA